MSNRLPRIQRINVDSVKHTFNRESSTLNVLLPVPVVQLPEAYNVAVEKSEVPLKNIPLGILPTSTIAIDYPSTGVPVHPVLEPKMNLFTVSGKYHSIQEFLDMINAVINDQIMPAFSLGSFSYDPVNLRIEFKFGDPADRAMIAAGCEVFFDENIINLLPGIPGLFATTPDLSLGPNFYKVTYDAFLGSATGVVIKSQTSYLLPVLFMFKSLRIYSTLPTQPYLISDHNTGHTTRSNMLCDMMIDSQNFQEGRTNQLYIPINLAFAELTGVSPIAEFQLRFMLHMSNGHEEPIELSKNDYLSVTLRFDKVVD